MRARNIKPGFYKNEQLAECSFTARLLFPGLWMLADRKGRMEYRPKRIKAEIFPFDDVDVCPLVEELSKEGLIVKYESGSMEYIWIPCFLKHQTPHSKEKQSEIPPYPYDGLGSGEENTRQAPDKSDACTRQAPDSPIKGSGEHPLNPESLTLNPESLILNPDCGSLKPDCGSLKPDLAARPESSVEMYVEWVPSEFFPTLANVSGLELPNHSDIDHAIREFKAYWLTKKTKRTAHEWDLAFVRSLKKGFSLQSEKTKDWSLKKGVQRLSPRQQYMEDVGNLLEAIDGTANQGYPTRLGQAVEPLPGVRPQLEHVGKIGV